MNEDDRRHFESEVLDLVRNRVESAASISVEPSDLNELHYMRINVEPIRDRALDFSVHVASDRVLNVTAGNQWFDLAASSRVELLSYLDEFLRAAAGGLVTEAVWTNRKGKVYRSHLRIPFGDRVETFRYFDLSDFPMFGRTVSLISYNAY